MPHLEAVNASSNAVHRQLQAAADQLLKDLDHASGAHRERLIDEARLLSSQIAAIMRVEEVMRDNNIQMAIAED